MWHRTPWVDSERRNWDKLAEGGGDSGGNVYWLTFTYSDNAIDGIAESYDDVSNAIDNFKLVALLNTVADPLGARRAVYYICDYGVYNNTYYVKLCSAIESEGNVTFDTLIFRANTSSEPLRGRSDINVLE